ncbi:transposase [Devosia sp. PTR5]|uniref:Transposase n=1 Tax=Devosia oryzisoli TaxID=2774138 RepID=A0A927FTK8_9HYPH|nr:transposase [Devosia oryzisoli]MBD8066040.1 transposase [Devosia oryzisoli]
MDQADISDDEHYEAEKAREAFQTLCDTDRVSLGRIARILAARENLASADELISEAYVRTVSGTRRWKRSQSFVQFFAGVMKSLASDASFLPDSRKVEKIAGGYSALAGDQVLDVEAADNTLELQQKALVEEMYDHLDRHFEGDEEMQMLLMGLQEGLRGEELEGTIGVDTKRLAALRTRFKRQVDKFIAAYRAREGQSHG